MEYNSLFNYLDKEEAAKFQPEIPRDWKWSYKDYPDKNGLKVFSCFACGGKAIEAWNRRTDNG